MSDHRYAYLIPGNYARGWHIVLFSRELAIGEVEVGNRRIFTGLIRDLKARGMLEETLLVWTGEFGRTPYEQDLSNGKGSMESYGRGHNPFGFTTLMAGGGIRGGIVHGATDEYGYRPIDGKVHVHDLHAMMLHQLGLDHERLTYRYAGRDFRLTDVHGTVVKEILV